MPQPAGHTTRTLSTHPRKWIKDAQLSGSGPNHGQIVGVPAGVTVGTAVGVARAPRNVPQIVVSRKMQEPI